MTLYLCFLDQRKFKKDLGCKLKHAAFLSFHRKSLQENMLGFIVKI